MKVIKSCISKRIKNPFLNSYFADAKCYTPYSRLISPHLTKRGKHCMISLLEHQKKALLTLAKV